MRMRSLAGAIVLIAASAGPSCTRPPEKELAAANAAFRAARAAGAPSYAPDAWEKAVEAREAAQKALAEEEASGERARRFGEARNLLARAQDLAEHALREADAHREEAKREAGSALEEVQERLDETDHLLTRLESDCRQSSAVETMLESSRASLDGLEAQVTRITRAIQSEDYLHARKLGDEAGAALDEVMRRLNEVIQETGCGARPV